VDRHLLVFVLAVGHDAVILSRHSHHVVLASCTILQQLQGIAKNSFAQTMASRAVFGSTKSLIANALVEKFTIRVRFPRNPQGESPATLWSLDKRGTARRDITNG